MKKNFVLLLLIFMLAVTSSGCGKDDGTITVTMLCSGTIAENDFEAEILPRLVSEAYPNINLEVTKLPDNQYEMALMSKLSSGNAADIVMVQPMYASSSSALNLAELGYLEPITDLKAVELAGVGADSFRYNGEVYGIPSGVTILGTYYNKDVFDKYELEIPQNWEEFINVCKVLLENEVQPIVMGDKDKYVMQFGLYQIAANEIYPNNPEYDTQLRTGETKFTDEGTWDNVLAMYGSLYDEGYIDKSSLAIGSAQAIQKFNDGEAAMIFGGSFDSQNMKREGKSSFEVGYFPLPSTTGETYAAMSAGPGPAIYSNSEHVKECKQIFELLYDGESELYKAYVDAGRFVPTYGYGSDQVDELYSEFLKLYSEGRAFYWCNQAWPAGIAEEMENLFSDYIDGNINGISSITEGMQNKYDTSLNNSENTE